MNMFLVPSIMWGFFRASFAKNLPIITSADHKPLMRQAKRKYREIVRLIPPFQKDDILLVNILSAAMLASVYLSLPQKANVTQMEEYYRSAMNDSPVMRMLLKNTDNFSARRKKALASDAEKSQRATNPYTWRYTFINGETPDRFDAIFDRCGICALFQELGISEITPAMCAYDYEMARQTNTIFTREFTIASGGEVCDCHYKRREDR